MVKSSKLFALKKPLLDRVTAIRKRIPYRKTILLLRRRPFASFFVALGLLFLAIFAGNTLGKLGQKETVKPEVVKEVTMFDMGKAPTITVQAKVDKYGVYKIVAQTGGIVHTIHVKEGDEVDRGRLIVSLANNYLGGNALGLQASLAQKQYKNTVETLPLQKEIITKQRELAEKSSTSAEDLGKIASITGNDTRPLLNLNEQMLATIDQSLEQAELAGDPIQIAELRATKSQILASVVQLRSGLRNLEYQGHNDLAPAQISGIQKDLTLKQLEIQDKALDLQKDISKIQLDLAYVNASLMNPVSPVSGTVQRVYVREGQSISPGTVLAIMYQRDHAIVATANVPSEVARNISIGRASKVKTDDFVLSLTPEYVSTEATEGQLHTVKYQISLKEQDKLVDGQFISIELPITSSDTAGSIPFVPLDAVYQTQESAYVFVSQDGMAKSKTVTLGNVYGGFVEVKHGLKPGDRIITTRNVVAGERITIN